MSKNLMLALKVKPSRPRKARPLVRCENCGYWFQPPTRGRLPKYCQEKCSLNHWRWLNGGKARHDARIKAAQARMAREASQMALEKRLARKP